LTRLEHAVECLHEPGIDGDAVGRGGRLEAGVQAFRQAQGYAGAEDLVRGFGRRELVHVVDVDEVQVAAGDTDLDVALPELRRELERRLGERLLEATAQR
jgi:hypothetical protein